MANYVSRKLGHVNDPLVNKVLIDGSSVMTGPVNKAWRSLVLLHRATHAPSDQGNKGSRSKDPAKYNGQLLEKKADRETKVVTGYTKEITQDGKPKIVRFSGETDDGVHLEHGRELTFHLMRAKNRPTNANKIIIYNLFSESKYSYLVLQNRPSTLDFKGETTWASIKSMGRNTPMYHYTGAEDTLQFNISWYANDPNHPDEVINKCRLLESWSKANGYKSSPPLLMLQWGSNLKDNLFKGHVYILISATYTLKNFNDCYRELDSNRRATLINRGLFPAAATQELVFKRVSDTNLEYSDILPEDKMEYTRGINKQ